jgi:tetratricopeptide (TPR) repeat protein
MAVRVIRKCVELTVMVWLMTNIAARSVHAQDQVPCDSAIGIIESLQGIVEVRRQNDRLWRAAKLGERVCPDDAIRVGEYGRAALALAETNEVLRLDQNTTIRLPAAAGQERPLLDLVMGVVQFFSNHPRSLNVRTPFLNAGVEGTEFLVRVTSDETFLIVFNGRVRAENQLGAIVVSGDQAVTARASAAPVPQVPVRPRDAVRWAIHYPPVLDDLAPGAARRGASDLPEAVRAAIELYRQNRIAEAIARLAVAPGAPVDPRVLIYRAGLLLQVGRVDEANADLTRVLATNPDRSDALALRAVTAVALNDRDRALADASRAVAQDSGSDAALVTQSYALQASFRLDEARVAVSVAVERNPDNALAWARLAELWLSLGYRKRALEAARRAQEIAPDLARTQLVLGFAQLAAMDTTAAEATFRRAIESDTTDPQSRLGLGLARIRRNDMKGGRGELELAAGLDPSNSLVRSYLGKAYDEENRSRIAGEQFSIAKALDQADPTPWFYDAIRKQTENRPVEALADVERAIALNDNRAVYRSSFLLDEDLAVRNVSLGRIYQDLGFEQRSRVEATKSLSFDPANSSAHRFLSDSVADDPRQEIVRASELLQAQVLQPLSAVQVQPRLAITDLNAVTGLGPSEVSFNEFTPLFAREQLRFTGTGVVGNNGTYGDEAVLSGLYGRFAFSLGQFHYETEGFRPNNQIKYNVYNLFSQAQLTDEVGIQLELRKRNLKHGDLSSNYDESFLSDYIRSLHEDVARVGLHYDLSPQSNIIATMTRTDRDETVRKPINGLLTTEESADQVAYDGQVRYFFDADRFNLSAGGGTAKIDTKFHDIPSSSVLDSFREAFTGPIQTEVMDRKTEQSNAYIYIDVKYPKNMIWTFGLSYDDFDNELIQQSVLNPKFGVQWNITDFARLRLAALKTFKRELIVDQTFEPTQVAGFSQFYDDFNGSSAKLYGVGIDVNWKNGIYLGAEAIWRDLDSYAISRNSNLSVQNGEGLIGYNDIVFTNNHEERLFNAYAYWTPHDNWALGIEYKFENIITEDNSIREMDTMSIPVSARYFHQNGLFASLTTTFVRQEIKNGNPGRLTNDNTFALLDAGIGYRFPNRAGLFSLEVRNLLDRKFRFQDLAFISDQPDLPLSNQRFAPARTFIGVLTVKF